MSAEVFIIDELAGLIATGKEPDSPHFRRGTVTALDVAGGIAAMSVTVRLHGSTTDLPKVALASSCAASVGDNVWVFRLGNTLMAWSNPTILWKGVAASGGAAPALQNGWVNFAGGYHGAGYRMDLNGTVELRGLIKSGTMNTSAFNMPVPYRPRATHLIPTYCGTPDGAGRIDINSGGDVIPVFGANAYFSLHCRYSLG